MLRPLSLAAFFAFVTVSLAAQTAVPVITQVADRDSTIVFARHGSPQSIHLTATNSPTRFDATGYPPEVTFSPDGVFAWDDGNLKGGAYTVSVTATNAAGTSAPMTFHWRIHPGMIYWIAPSTGSARPGDTITFTAQFSVPVVVTGTPYIPLWGTKKAVYTSGSGTATLTFTYQVGVDDPSVSNYTVGVIAAGDGTISSTDGVSATLIDGYQDLSNNGLPFSITNPTPAPEAITSIWAYGSTDVNELYVAVHSTHDVIVSGTPLLHLTIGGAARTATLYSHVGNALSFRYLPQPGDSGPLAVQSPLELNGGSITGANGLPANLGFNTPDLSTTVIDGTPPSAPVITSITPSGTPTITGTAEPNSQVSIWTSSGTYVMGQRLSADGHFNITWFSPALPAGSYTFYATAMDAASNRSAPSAPVTFTISYPSKPATPVITGIEDSGYISGTATPGTAIYTFRDGALTSFFTGTTQADGTWRILSWINYSSSPNAGTAKFTAVAYDNAGNASDRSAPVSYTFPAPVVQDATVNGQVGQPITPVQLQSSASSPTFTTQSNLGTFGLQLSPTGLITGTPTRDALNYVVWFTARNGAGPESPAGRITLNLAPATPPPPTTTPPPTNTPPTTTTPPPTTTPPGSKSDQTITFSSPVSAIIVGQPIQLGATSSAGLPITYSVVAGDATLNGSTLTPTSTADLIVRASSAGSDTVNATSVDVNFGTPQKGAQAITLATTGGTVPAEKSITLSGTASSGLPITYTVVSGPATVSGNTLTFTGTGNVVVQASQSGNGSYTAADTTLTFTANPVDRLVNISSRLRVGPDAGHTAIAGFVVTGTQPKPMLIRAVGPGLSAFAVNDGAAAPQLHLMDHAGNVIATNSGWNDDAQISATGEAVGAFPLAHGSKDAAILMNLAPGLYTAQVLSNTTGSILIEIYDAAATAAVPTKQLINISTRGGIDAGDVMIAGFVVKGAQSKRVLIRAVGPGLSAFAVPDVLADPTVEVHDGTGAVIAQNDDWETPEPLAGRPTPASAAEITAANTASGAFALHAGAKDAAVVLMLAPGSYSAVVRGANGSAGAAIVEVYEVDSTP